MKYIDIPSLSHLSQVLTYDSPECKVYTRLEAYSCKDVRKERKLRKEMEDAYKSEWEDDLSISPEQKADYLSSPFGSLTERASRNLHFLLISTLNVAFPDYDFSGVRPDEFTRERGAGEVLRALSGTLMLGRDATGSSPRSYGSYPSGLTSPPLQHANLPGTSGSGSPSGSSTLSSVTHPTLHRILNDVISLDDCVVYSYIPSAEADPHAEDQDLGDDDGNIGDLPDDEEDDRSESPGIDPEEDDAMMIMSMDEDEDGMDGTDGQEEAISPRGRRNSRHRKGSMASLKRSGLSGLTSGSDWDSSFTDSGPPTPGPNRYAPIKTRGGLLWSANYFFYSKRQKRILFMSVWARKKSFGFSPQAFSTATLPPPMVAQPQSFQGSHSLPNFASSSPFGQHSLISPQAKPLPSLAGLAATFHNDLLAYTANKAGQSNTGRPSQPMAIAASAAPPPSTSALNATGTTAASGGAEAMPSLRRQRSASVASSRSAGDVLQSVKRVKV